MNGLPELTPQLRALADALGGIPAPCMTGDAEAWFEDRATAVRLCLGCHALEQCAGYAASIRPSHGVWAGVDHETRSTHRRTA